MQFSVYALHGEFSLITQESIKAIQTRFLFWKHVNQWNEVTFNFLNMQNFINYFVFSDI